MKRSRMQQMSMEVTVGAFLFMVLLALGVFTIILSSDNIFTKKHHVEVVFDDVMGLREGDSISVRGLKVGKIYKLWLEPDGVHLILSTEEKLDLRDDYSVQILVSSVLGGRYLQVFQGDGEPLPEGTLLDGSPPIDLITEATETFGSIKEALVDGGILDNLKRTMEEFETLGRNLNAGRGTLGKLLTDDQAYTNFVALTENIEQVSRDLKEGTGSLGRLLHDESLAKDLEATAANLRVTSQRLADGEGLLGKLLSEDDQVYNDLQAVVASLKEISGRMEAGEGTLGRLMTDAALYEEAQLLMKEVRAAVDDLRETAPITTFTSIFFGAF